MIHLPFQPLEVRAAERLAREMDLERSPYDTELAMFLGVHPKSISHYRRVGLSIWQADNLAIRLNLHPMEVWGLAAWMGTIDVVEDSEG